MEDLAKAIFNAWHETDDPACPIASWENQPITEQERYIRAAEVVSVMLSNGAVRIEPVKDVADGLGAVAGAMV